MSQIAPQAHEPVEIVRRNRLTPSQIRELRERQDWLCGCGCGKSLTSIAGPFPDELPPRLWWAWVDEHVLPLELGGTNDLSNRAIYLVECAKRKTREDRKRIDKARRIRKTEAGDVRPKRKIVGRGFAKDLSRGFDGKVRARRASDAPT